MKVEKLITLSQFCELIQAKVMAYEIESNMFGLVCNYKDFLKQPLTKEMFINDVHIPLKGDYGLDAPEFNTYKYPIETYESDLLEYEEAEKKVIFKGNWRYQEDDRYNFVKWVSLGLEKVMFNKYNTLSELAEATQGNLELNNVEI